MNSRSLLVKVPIVAKPSDQNPTAEDFTPKEWGVSRSRSSDHSSQIGSLAVKWRQLLLAQLRWVL